MALSRNFRQGNYINVFNLNTKKLFIKRITISSERFTTFSTGIAISNTLIFATRSFLARN